VDEQNRERLSAALPWPTNTIGPLFAVAEAQKLLPQPGTLLQLYVEAYNTYVAGFLRASIILSGECVQRCLHFVIMRAIRNGTYSHPPFSIRGTRRTITLKADSKNEELKHLGEMSYQAAINTVMSLGVFLGGQEQWLDDVRDIRNSTVHGEIPYVDKWSNTSLPTIDLNAMLKSGASRSAIEEALKKWEHEDQQRQASEDVYRIWVPTKELAPHDFEHRRFEMKDHICTSLRELHAREKCAAITFALAERTLKHIQKHIFGGTDES
jgi:hypothetical protein